MDTIKDLIKSIQRTEKAKIHFYVPLGMILQFATGICGGMCPKEGAY
jgi:hypothetical protein